MSKNYNDCDIVFDLLPLYLDGKTGAESNVFVKEHLAGCPECREVHQFMSAELPGKKPEVSGQTIHKRRRITRRTKRLLILVAGLIGYLCLMAGIVMYAFWILAADVL